MSPDVPLNYTVEQAQTEVKAAVAPLGADYVAALDRAFRDRWIDYYPTQGKKSGAYMNPAAYDVHPYLLLNFNGQYTDMSALAHELGHAMHSWFASKAQPYQLYNYPIFVAEVASTFNEALLIDHELKKITDPKVRLALLGNYLENVKGTVFRQTQFAEFELRMHERAEKGEPLTGDALAKLYLDITRKYYGHDAKVCMVDDYIAHEWSYVPHFYSPFYVYQYATSFTASTALAEKVLAGDPQAVAALPRVPGGRRVEISDRSAEGRRRGHDDERAARSDDREDGSGDGRDRETAQVGARGSTPGARAGRIGSDRVRSGQIGSAEQVARSQRHADDLPLSGHGQPVGPPGGVQQDTDLVESQSGCRTVVDPHQDVALLDAGILRLSTPFCDPSTLGLCDPSTFRLCDP